jgi:hypothetical protein
MEEYRADDDLEQCKAPHASYNTQKFPLNAKTRIKTCVGIEVSYLKCRHILKLRNPKSRKIIH